MLTSCCLDPRANNWQQNQYLWSKQTQSSETTAADGGLDQKFTDNCSDSRCGAKTQLFRSRGGLLTSSSAFSLREASGCQRREWGGLRSNCSLRMGRIQEMQNAPGVFGEWFILGRNQNGPRPVIHVAKKQPNWPEVCALFVTKQC